MSKKKGDNYFKRTKDCDYKVLNIVFKGRDTMLFESGDNKAVYSTCHEDDKFDEYTGAVIALAKFYGKTSDPYIEKLMDLDEPKFKKGDLVFVKEDVDGIRYLYLIDGVYRNRYGIYYITRSGHRLYEKKLEKVNVSDVDLNDLYLMAREDNILKPKKVNIVAHITCDGIDYFRWGDGKGGFGESPIDRFVWKKK